MTWPPAGVSVVAGDRLTLARGWSVNLTHIAVRCNGYHANPPAGLLALLCLLHQHHQQTLIFAKLQRPKCKCLVSTGVGEESAEGRHFLYLN